MWFDYRDRERVKVFYREQSFREQLDKYGYSGKSFAKKWSRPSFNVLIDRLRKTEREKFYELRKAKYPVDTIIDGLGFKTLHRSGECYVYVLDMGPWENRYVKKIDHTRERAHIKKRDEQIRAFHENHSADLPWEKRYLTSAAYQTREQYVDNLTKKQQLALTLIRMMDYDDFVEGVGGKKLGYGNVDQFVLDC